MSIDEEMRRNIDRQMITNRRKNLYRLDRDQSFSFSPETLALLRDRRELRALIERSGRDELVDYVMKMALRELYDAYQYISVKPDDLARLRDLYHEMIADALEENLPADTIARRHYERLAAWLASTNPITRTINPPNRPVVRDIVCAEYSPELQMEILGIDLHSIMEPVIDIGCGEHGWLVRHLRALGIEAHGIDRACDAEGDYLVAADWFERDIPPGFWGTIIAHLSFSGHFLNHHARRDGEYIAYAKKYMEMLRGLRIGGRCHYAPGLEFIEEMLPAHQYTLERSRVSDEYSRTIITRLA